MKKIAVLVILIYIVLSGCKGDMPEPESFYSTAKVSASTFKHSKEMIVRHIVQGSQLYVECVVSNVTFSENNKEAKKGKIVVTIDGNKVEEYNTAAFVVKNLKQGVRHVKLEVRGNKNENLGLSKEFYVTIP